jgi:hypothetical protein
MVLKIANVNCKLYNRYGQLSQHFEDINILRSDLVQSANYAFMPL